MVSALSSTRSAPSGQLPAIKFKRCKCGKCSGCRENERWERIFEARHGAAERAYYAQRPAVPIGGVSARGFLAASIYACTDEREAGSTR
jgi:hypothetical protein